MEVDVRDAAGEELVTSTKQIRKKYKSRPYTAMCHVVASAPLEVLLPFVVGEETRKYFGPLQLLSLFRVNKLLRVVDVHRLVPQVEAALLASRGTPRSQRRPAPRAPPRATRDARRQRGAPRRS